MKSLTLRLGLLLVLMLVGLASQTVLAQTCETIWANSADTLAEECSQESIRDNFMCYAHETMSVYQTNGSQDTAFDDPGEMRNVFGVQRIAAAPYSTSGIGGMAWLKLLVHPNTIENVKAFQAVSIITFGDAVLTNVQNNGDEVFSDQGGVCTARIRPGATTNNLGTYIRAIPDPSFQSACIIMGCPDKNNLLYLVGEGEALHVLGISGDGRSFLVRNDYATGWISSSSTFVDSDCNPSTLRVFSDNAVVNSLNQETELPAFSAFTISHDSSSNVSCSAEDIPDGGVLVANTSDQHIRFEVNQIDISQQSTVFLRAYSNRPNELTVFVLQGNVTVTRNGVSVSATSGEVIAPDFATGNLVNLSRSGRTNLARANWCNAFTRIVRSIYPPPIVPDERTEYCRDAPPNGYELPFLAVGPIG